MEKKALSKVEYNGEQYREQLAKVLKIDLNDIFKLKEKMLSLLPNLYELSDDVKIQRIRNFLRQNKLEIKKEFHGSIFGESGCFPLSVKICFLAGIFGIDLRLARSTKVLSFLHILLVSPDASKIYDATKIEKHKPTELSLSEVKLYFNIIQRVMNRLSKLKTE